MNECTAVEPKREKYVVARVDNLRGVIERIEDRVNLLRERLNPVLHPTPSSVQEGKDASPECPLADDLYKMTSKLSDVEAVIDALIDSLEV